MNLEQTQTDIQNANEKLPFSAGDLVMMRSVTTKLVKYRFFDPADIGIVLEVNKASKRPDKFILSIYWQRTGKTSKMYNSRVKKA